MHPLVGKSTLNRLELSRAEPIRYARIAADTGAEMTRVISQIRARCPQVPVLLRADSGFCREALMAWW